MRKYIFGFYILAPFLFWSLVFYFTTFSLKMKKKKIYYILVPTVISLTKNNLHGKQSAQLAHKTPMWPLKVKKKKNYLAFK